MMVGILEDQINKIQEQMNEIVVSINNMQKTINSSIQYNISTKEDIEKIFKNIDFMNYKFNLEIIELQQQQCALVKKIDAITERQNDIYDYIGIKNEDIRKQFVMTVKKENKHSVSDLKILIQSIRDDIQGANGNVDDILNKINLLTMNATDEVKNRIIEIHDVINNNHNKIDDDILKLSNKFDENSEVIKNEKKEVLQSIYNANCEVIKFVSEGNKSVDEKVNSIIEFIKSLDDSAKLILLTSLMKELDGMVGNK
jgi:predicted  nucleic acid-binding Zn-ribbon protein